MVVKKITVGECKKLGITFVAGDIVGGVTIDDEKASAINFSCSNILGLDFAVNGFAWRKHVSADMSFDNNLPVLTEGLIGNNLGMSLDLSNKVNWGLVFRWKPYLEDLTKMNIDNIEKSQEEEQRMTEAFEAEFDLRKVQIENTDSQYSSLAEFDKSCDNSELIERLRKERDDLKERSQALDLQVDDLEGQLKKQGVNLQAKDDSINALNEVLRLKSLELEDYKSNKHISELKEQVRRLSVTKKMRGKEINKLSRIIQDNKSEIGMLCEMNKKHRQADCVAEWDGNGIPPVGCECEYRSIIDHPKDYWVECNIKYSGKYIVVAEHCSGGSLFENALDLMDYEFRKKQNPVEWWEGAAEYLSREGLNSEEHELDGMKVMANGKNLRVKASLTQEQWKEVARLMLEG